MDTPPYPLPRSTRETEILQGDGGATYGPFAFKVFDIEDVRAYVRPDGAEDFLPASFAASKVADLPFDDFMLTFAEALPETADYLVQSARLHHRDVSTTRGGAVSGRELEKELSKQGSVIEELRRDINRGGIPVPAIPGRVPIIGEDGRPRSGPFAADIENAQENAALAEAARIVSEAMRDEAVAAAAGVTLPLAVTDTMLVQKTDLTGYEALTAPAVRRFLGHGETISYFDFVPRNLRTGIADGSDTATDQAPYWQAFRDALQAEATAGRQPHGFIPKCVVRTSVSPNFAIPFLKLDTEGCPRIICTSANPGFRIDATGLGVGGWGLFGLRIGSLMAGSATGAKGIEIRYCHQSHFDPLYSMGATNYGIYISFCVSTVFNKPACSLSYLGGSAFLATPATGIILTAEEGDIQGTACGWCTVIGPIGEHVNYGLWLGRAQGTIIIGGTAESCTEIGIVMTAHANYTSIFGTDFEANTHYDVYCSAIHCAFVNLKTEKHFLFRENANNNVVLGGQHNILECTPTTKHNTFRDLLYAGRPGGGIVDLGDRNRFINCWNHQTEKVHSEWKTIADLGVSSTGGTAPTATAAGRFFVDGMTVHFTLEITVSVGSGAGALTVAMPYAAVGSRSYCFAGIEIGHDGDGVTGYLPNGSVVMQVRHADGSYPGDANDNFITISGSYETA